MKVIGSDVILVVVTVVTVVTAALLGFLAGHRLLVSVRLCNVLVKAQAGRSRRSRPSWVRCRAGASANC